MMFALALCLSLAVSADGDREEILRGLPLSLADGEQEAKTAPVAVEAAKKEESPWLIAPLMSLNPKLGFSVGAIIGYMFYADEKSKFSMIGLNGQYTSTGSVIAGLVAKLSLGEDYHRIIALALGGTGFRSGGMGLVLYHDSRDSETSPTKGFYINANNIGYREWMAGDQDFDVIRVDAKAYFPEGGGHVLALRQFNQFTIDAPPSAFAPIQLRGYKFGQYLGENMSSIEAEERFRLGDRFTATVFTGVGFLYGNGQSLTDPETIYPNIGAGLQFVLKEKEGIVANLEFAAGKRENYGVYIKLGYGF